MAILMKNEVTKISLSLTVILLLCTGVDSVDSTVVRVNQGELEGVRSVLPSGNVYYSFKGIPYAKPPIGSLRFKDPEPPLSWQGVRDASKHQNSCIQPPLPLVGATNTNEDCLYLNVYTREIKENNKIPVMLWIHGGAFLAGSGDSDFYGPEKLLEKDIVVVTINYRLGAFGFMNLDTPEVPGNAGLKDQVMAMKWVKENIIEFGGDPDDVTIAGESAGAGSVALHLISPLSKGLFSKAIAQSGSCLADWSFSLNANEVSHKTAAFLGYDSKNESQILSFLQNIPTNDFLAVSQNFVEKDSIHDIIFLPSIEKIFNGVSSFLNKRPIEYLVSGEYSDVPFISGVNSGEGLVFLLNLMNKIEFVNKKFDLGVSSELKENRDKQEIFELSNEIKQFYLENENITTENVLGLTNLASDMMFIYPAFRLSRLLTKKNTNPNYFYYFTYNDDETIINKALKGPYVDKLPITAHGSELGLLFNGSLSHSTTNVNSLDLKMSQILIEMWTNFCKHGNPTPGVGGVNWERFSPENKNYLEIDLAPSMKTNFLKERIDMWEKLYKEKGLPY